MKGIILQVFDFRFKGRKFMYSTGKVIDESLWLKKKERAKVIPAREGELLELNSYLQKLEQRVVNFLSSKHDSKTILRADLKQKLNETKVDEQKELIIKQRNELEMEKQRLEEETNFYCTWEKIISTTKKRWITNFGRN